MTKAEEIRSLIQGVEKNGDYNINLVRAIGDVIINNQALSSFLENPQDLMEAA